MSGKLFARTLKQNPELRRDYFNWLQEQRNEHSRELETAGAEIAIFHAQGKIRALDNLKTLLETAMNLSSEETEQDNNS